MTQTERYREFFFETAEGQEFVRSLHDMIAREHEHAEDKPELSRDYTQRAKGVRQVLDHISVMTTEVKKSRNATSGELVLS